MKRKREIPNTQEYFTRRLNIQRNKSFSEQIPLAEMMFNKLKLAEHTAYLIDVKMSEVNVMHRAVLFVGFKSGGYCEIYNNSYEKSYRLDEAFYIRIIKKLCSIK